MSRMADTYIFDGELVKLQALLERARTRQAQEARRLGTKRYEQIIAGTEPEELSISPALLDEIVLLEMLVRRFANDLESYGRDLHVP